MPSPNLILDIPAWCKWDPSPAIYFNISIHPGDEVSLAVSGEGTSGMAIIENHTTCETVGELLTSSNEICKSGVNWAVELWGDGNSTNSFADFGTITFSNAVASTPNGKSGPSNATGYSFGEGKNLTTVWTTDTEVAVQFIGN